MGINMEMNQPIYPVEEWRVTEKAFEVKNIYRNETTFALSNGYIGTRGTLEEGYDFSAEEGLEGNFINGFYESEHIRYGEWNYGFPTESQSLLNLPNLKTTRILLDGEVFDLRTGKVMEYERVLLMKEGRVERKLIWTSPKGKQLKLHTSRFASFEHKNLLVNRICVTPLNFSGEIQFVSVCETDVENHTRKTNPLVDYGPFGRHLTVNKLMAREDTIFYEGTTVNSRLTMACGSRQHITAGETRQQSSHIEEAAADITYLADAETGKEIIFDKFIIYTSALDMPIEQLESFTKEELQKACKTGYVALEEEQTAYMGAFWNTADVIIRGDAALQQGIRFNLFHIMQAAGRDGRTGMGAKGLSGEGYEGHYFWDTEMYILPVFAYTDTGLAKSLLDYRYDTLEEARKRARVLGHPAGALYPWRTINGKEASTYYPLGTAQYHINADIAYAFKLYVEVAGDYEYLEQRAAEVLVETARVWADVGCFADSKDGRYCICAVTGPDEYNAIVDNNFYTNLMARENIRDAIWALDTVKENNSEVYLELTGRLQISREEVEYWQKIVDNMYFPYDEKRQVYPLDDGFMMRKPWDDSKIPPKKRHLLYENYHPLFIFRQRMSKQADAILGMLLHSNLFTEEELRRNYDFYQEVTLHHSSLSTCIFGILASQIGYHEQAYEYFMQSARMDLDDYHNNFYAGIHAANMAGTWQAIVFGFAGVRTNRGMLEFKITMPKQWKGYSFRLGYQGSLLQIDIEPAAGTDKLQASFTLVEGNTAGFWLGEKEIRLTEKGEVKIETV